MANNSKTNLQELILRCWGKTDLLSNDPMTFHPALFHMIDIGNIAQILLTGKTSNRWKSVFSSLYDVDTDELSKFLPFIISLHDIGKISASFQRVNNTQYLRMVAEGYSFGKSNDIPHPEVGRNFIDYEWVDQERVLVSEKTRKIIREMVAGHHGLFASPGTMKDTRLKIKHDEPVEWIGLRNTAFELLADIFLDQTINKLPEPRNISAVVMELTGFSTLCDWIGSDQRYFRAHPELSLEEYKVISLEFANRAVQDDGFNDPVLSGKPSTFQSIFLDISDPRPLQFAIDSIPDDILSVPTLIVIEAPTGEGKTEAALALAHKIALTRKTDEFYYALPTTATSNQMFRRVQKYLKENLLLGIGAKLIHGQAFLAQDAIKTIPLSNGTRSDNERDPIDWFSSKKRSLLAPFGVGTIDQIELGALNVRHASLRLSGLAGKVVILDEVHAYDTYMTTIIIRLLNWLYSLGTSVILLSATLPANRRAQLMKTYSHKTEDDCNHPEYPLILIANDKANLKIFPKAYQPSREVGLDFLRFPESDPKGKAQWLIDQVISGGCACWITNTVNRAQEIYEQVAAIAPGNVMKILFHARFPLEQRQEIEERIVRIVGKEKFHRPQAAIVIGTQVLEQSLDLDFDVMVSDLAPVDLLLQRAGRLHRHSETRRPEDLKKPKFYINTPLNDGSDPILTIDKYVYAEYFLKRTFYVLRTRDCIQLPGDFRKMVKEVYDEIPEEMSIDLRKAYEDLCKQEEKAREEAVQRLLPEPDPDELFTGPAARITFTESETDASWIVAQTRLGERSVNIIPLEDLGDCFTFSGCIQPIQKNLSAPREVEMAMLRQQIRINQDVIINELLSQKADLPCVFSNSPLLKDCLPLWLKSGKLEIKTAKGKFVLQLDNELGLLIKKKGGL